MNRYLSLSRILRLSILLSVPLLINSFSSSEAETIQNNAVTDCPPGFSTPWVDSVYNSLTIDQRIAQLMVIEVSSDQNRTYNNRIERIIKTYNPGGVIFFKGGPGRQISLTNQWQRAAQTPLLISMDAEWGLSMRLDSTISFPRQITLGAITNERLIYELGFEMGRQARRMGIHMTFSPVVDVNSNPDNPVINSRSFGECRYNVTRKGMAMMFGIQDAGVIASAKHFPGHGDTGVDSHHALPHIYHSFEMLDSIHMFPFRHLIDKGLQSVMVAHLNVPSLGPAEEVPSSLSAEIVTGLLKNSMGFEGLIVTDALNMRGVTDSRNPGKIELMAFLAGNDILLMPQNMPQAITEIKQAIESGIIPEQHLEEKVKKILYFKEQAGLNNRRLMSLNNLYDDLHTEKVTNLNRKLAESSITLVQNTDNLLPLRRLDTLRIAALSIGSSVDNPFQAMLSNYAPLDMFSISKNHTDQQANDILQQLEKYNLVIVSVQNNSMFPGRNYGIPSQTTELVANLAKKQNIILNIFANPYSLKGFGNAITHSKAILVSYQDGRDFEEASAQVIFGAIAARGKLPVSVVPWFSLYAGINTSGGLRVKYSTTDISGINTTMLAMLDSLAFIGIRERAFPGCQIAVIKDGIMVYNKSFGFHTYDSTQQVLNSDLYDLASLTKIVATTSAIMKLYDLDRIQLADSIGQHLHSLVGSNKQGLILRDILTHQSRLRSWVPFYIRTLEPDKTSPEIYNTRQSEKYPTQVAENMFLRNDYSDSLFITIRDSELLARRRYIYSDLGFILLAKMVEEISDKRIDEFFENTVTTPLGLTNLGYEPLKRFHPTSIIPTEKDTLFRKQLLLGYVHDPTAAMMGGIAGHAGLFSNAADVAVYMQMLLQNGQYGGDTIFQEETIKEFTTTQFAGNQNRRGLGFDKPSLLKNDENNPACESASMLSFGHTGFTGTYAWADPKENLVYVFLSNRVHPYASNRKIIDMDIRTQIHQAIYNAIFFDRFVENNRLP